MPVEKSPFDSPDHAPSKIGGASAIVGALELTVQKAQMLRGSLDAHPGQAYSQSEDAPHQFTDKGSIASGGQGRTLIAASEIDLTAKK